MVRLPSGSFKLITIRSENTVCSLGKFGSFNPNHLLGHAYGFTYEIQHDKSLKKLTADTLSKIEEEVGNNEFIVDDNETNQVLSHAEIRALRDSGDREALIEKLKQNNKSYDLKTEYSKEKYTARKMAKFAPRFTTIPPTLFDVITFLTEKDPEKILNINQESMGFLLNATDVRPGCRYLVVDDVSGLLVAGLLELGADVTMVTESEHASLDVMKYFPQFNIETLFAEGRLKAVNWEQATCQEDVLADLDEYINSRLHAKGLRDGEKIEKRRAMKRVVTEFHETLFDGLVTMSHYVPGSIVAPLLSRIANSRKVAVYGPYREPLLDLRHEASPELLMPCIKELRAREYQVLPGRTRPVMTKRGEWGYVYHAIKVNRLEGVTAVGKNQAAKEKQRATINANKRKDLAETSKATVPTGVEMRPVVITSESTDELDMQAEPNEMQITEEVTDPEAKRIKLSGT